MSRGARLVARSQSSLEWLQWGSSLGLLHLSLGAFVALPLVALIERATLFDLPSLDDVIDCFRTHRGFLPARALEVALAARSLYDAALLTDRLGESCEERLVVTQLRDGDAQACPRAELTLVFLSVALELPKFRLGVRQSTFECREALSEPTLIVVGQTLNRL